ncbi:MAG: hypothetical protein RJB08_788, partial [Actinomycetota bacterium]
FAMPGAVDRLREFRDTIESEFSRDLEANALVLSATDPAQPFGSVLAWPPNDGRPARSASSVVVLVDGAAFAWFDTRSGNLVPLCETSSENLRVVAGALAALGKDGRVRTVRVQKVNGRGLEDCAFRSVMHDALVSCGFVEGYRGYVQR